MGRSARLKPARLAEKLLAIRIRLGLSQNEMIRHLGLTDMLYQSNVSGFEVGEREPALPILLQYARAAGISTDVLIDDGLDLPHKLPVIAKNETENSNVKIDKRKKLL
jgi:transcriptional regulator with XRE-family HTH domain